MKKISKYLSIFLLITASYITYIHFAATGGCPTERILSQGKPYTGHYALGNISDGSFPNYTCCEEVENALGVFTVRAKGVRTTDSYIRKGWIFEQHQGVEKVNSRRNTTNVKVPQYCVYSPYKLYKRQYMTPIYLITLADGLEIGAVIDPKYVERLENGELVTLPIGKKISLSDEEASELFQTTSINTIYYALNDSWYRENLAAINRNAAICALGVLSILGISGRYLKRG